MVNFAVFINTFHAMWDVFNRKKSFMLNPDKRDNTSIDGRVIFIFDSQSIFKQINLLWGVKMRYSTEKLSIYTILIKLNQRTTTINAKWENIAQWL